MKLLILHKWVLRTWDIVSSNSFLMLCLQQLHGSDRDELWKTVLIPKEELVMTRKNPVVHEHADLDRVIS